MAGTSRRGPQRSGDDAVDGQEGCIIRRDSKETKWPPTIGLRALMKEILSDLTRPTYAKENALFLCTFSSLVLLLWKYLATPSALATSLSRFFTMPDAERSGILFHFCGSVILLGVLPILTAKLFLGGCFRQYGLSLGPNPRNTWASCVCCFIPILASGIFGLENPEVVNRFPLWKGICSEEQHIPTYFVLQSLHYSCWEFFFRGFLYFPLRQSLGLSAALGIQTMASSLAHIGTPFAEASGAILAGLLWGVQAEYTQSIIPGAIQHSLLGIVVDIVLCSRP